MLKQCTRILSTPSRCSTSLTHWYISHGCAPASRTSVLTQTSYISMVTVPPRKALGAGAIGEQKRRLLGAITAFVPNCLYLYPPTVRIDATLSNSPHLAFKPAALIYVSYRF